MKQTRNIWTSIAAVGWVTGMIGCQSGAVEVATSTADLVTSFERATATSWVEGDRIYSELENDDGVTLASMDWHLAESTGVVTLGDGTALTLSEESFQGTLSERLADLQSTLYMTWTESSPVPGQLAVAGPYFATTKACDSLRRYFSWEYDGLWMAHSEPGTAGFCPNRDECRDFCENQCGQELLSFRRFERTSPEGSVSKICKCTTGGEPAVGNPPPLPYFSEGGPDYVPRACAPQR